MQFRWLFGRQDERQPILNHRPCKDARGSYAGKGVLMTLDEKYIAAKRAYDNATEKHGPRSILAAMALRELRNLTTRILKRDKRKRRAA